jgi:hypothetical protein
MRNRILLSWLPELMIGFVLVGCAERMDREFLELATHSVQRGLETWKRGERADALRTGATPIEFHDDDWQKSARLVDFQLLKSYVETDGSPRCAAALVIQYRNRQPQRIRVTYEIVRRSTVIVARDPFS